MEIKEILFQILKYHNCEIQNDLHEHLQQCLDAYESHRKGHGDPFDISTLKPLFRYLKPHTDTYTLTQALYLYIHQIQPDDFITPEPEWEIELRFG